MKPALLRIREDLGVNSLSTLLTIQFRQKQSPSTKQREPRSESHHDNIT